ncbi:MAG TPA: NAD(P)-dependent oxidoreductase [Candidatus Methylacidiphilales bacterium]|nr:NAD(P)-dependent oxidoreductase [Candidatus Methylacidiphilales bacterium]
MVRKSQKSPFALPASDLAHILDRARGEWEALRGKSLFVTGGTGFFGKWLLGSIIEAQGEWELGLRVTVLSRSPEAFLQQFPEAAALQFIKGDVADFFPPPEHFDYVVHAATVTSSVETPKQEEERMRAMIAGTQRALDLARRDGARFLNVSSGAVYGTFTSQLSGAKEDDFEQAQPLFPYAAGKREGERLCSQAAIDFVTARCFAFLGPHLPLDAHFAAGNFLRDALRGGPVIVRGDGTALRSYLHPADLIVWLLHLLLHGRRGRAYNVGSDETVTTARLARLIADTVDPAIAVTVQSSQPLGPQNIYLPNISRARAELGLEVWLPLPEAIARTVAFHANNRAG